MNYRLAGDATEDPQHPKILFPSKFKCPQCYLNDTGTGDSTVFSNTDVMNYLQGFYSIDNIEGVTELDDQSRRMQIPKIEQIAQAAMHATTTMGTSSATVANFNYAQLICFLIVNLFLHV